MDLNVKIRNIKGISCADFSFPLEKGVYAFVGANGSGKSTILQAIAQLIRPQNALFALRRNDYGKDSVVEFSDGLLADKWYVGKNKRYLSPWKNSIYTVDGRGERRFNNIKIHGMYEGSLFVGTRFKDSKQVDTLIDSGKIIADNLVSADDYVIRHLSYILHGDYEHYTNLVKLKNSDLKNTLRLKNFPYFINSSYGGLISQYRMSSGECLLISLLHFIYNAIIRKSLPVEYPVLMLLDEIELALHPLAVSRLLDLIMDIIENHNNVVAVLTTHAPEVIRRINPSNIYKLENERGTISMINPCYPSYAIRELYTHDKYDVLILCEDELSKKIIDRTINKWNMRSSKLICVLPVGPWNSVLRLHQNVLQNNVIGIGTKVISVIDKDVRIEVEKAKSLNRSNLIYLPVASVEKYLFDILYNNSDKKLKKLIGDKYFQVESIDLIIADYRKKCTKVNEKGFYKFILNNLETHKISEDTFISSLCDDISAHVDIKTFAENLKNRIG